MDEYRPIRFHQYFGASPLFTAKTPATGTFDGKKVAFMAGCSLSSALPDTVKEIEDWLEYRIPGIGIIQSCCGLPTKNMGDEKLFAQRIASLERDLSEMGAEMLITACPNCKKTIGTYTSVPVVTLWEVLPEIGLPEECKGKGTGTGTVFTIHDSCPARSDSATLDGVRRIMDELGYEVVESELSREKSICCGAGNLIPQRNPALSKEMAEKRLSTLPADNVVVYCASCRSKLLGAGGNVRHIAELIFGDPVTPDNPPPTDALAHTPIAWTNRYKSKRNIERRKR